MSARISSVICSSSILLCMTIWLLAEVLLREPGAVVGAYLASQTMSALLISQMVLLVLLVPVAMRAGALGERLSILLCPVLLPLPLMILAIMASDVSLAKSMLALALPVAIALVLAHALALSFIAGRKTGAAGIATLQLFAVAVIIAMTPAVYQWWQI